MEKTKKDSVVRHPFYQEHGLQFQCQRCSGCCRHSPGYVFLSANDVRHLLEMTAISLDEFIVRFLRVVNIGGFFRLSLTEKANYDCIFWENGGCLVYEKRPLQCSSFPFWSSLLSSEELWLEHRKICPGIGQGPLIGSREIRAWLDVRLAEPFIEISSVAADEAKKAISVELAKGEQR